jgi:prophage antirepressor-like protein
MISNTAIKFFEDKKVRTHWNEENEEWYFSAIDVVEILTRFTSTMQAKTGNDSVEAKNGFEDLP